jgi:8-oxo-dGTP diphosphatase
MWALPGGKLNCGKESLEEAAIRELCEETSFIAEEKDMAILAVTSRPDRDPRGHYIDHIFVVLEYKGEPIAGDDAAEVKYFDFKDLPVLAFDHEKSIKFLLHQSALLKLLGDNVRKSI